jgi:hypothetical protein
VELIRIVGERAQLLHFVNVATKAVKCLTIWKLLPCNQLICNNSKTASVLRTTVTNPGVGAFAKFREVTISFVMSVRPSVHMKQLGSHWTDFH